MPRKPNVIMLGIDSLRRDHMSLHGFQHLTTPHIDKWAAGGTVMEEAFSPSIPTTPAYSSMLTGMDCFGTNIVALRHEGTFSKGVVSLAEILKKEGYNTTCVGFEGNPASRGFSKYINYDSWSGDVESRAPKAHNLNEVSLPELDRLSKSKKPFFLFLRHMDPHSPYLPPHPYDRTFYGGNELDPKNKSMDPVFDFHPFRDYFAAWMPPGVTDKDYIIAQYNGAVAYMDACIQRIFAQVRDMGLEEDTLIVLTSDHGETLHDHECWYDHHGLYDVTLVVPMVFYLPGKVPAGQRLSGGTTLAAVTPTILDILGIKTGIKFDSKSLWPEISGRKPRKPVSEMYITECTWMRKHGWRTPEWKFIWALEPDMHFFPEVELYNLIDDPEEYKNLASKEKATVEYFKQRLLDWVAKREKQTGLKNPMYLNTNWHGLKTHSGPFESSQQAYDSLHIGNPEAARKLQARNAK